jgi:hypothetical protein
MSSHQRRALRWLFGVFAISGILALTGVACGIDYGTASEETELLKKLTVSGEFTTGSLLTMTLDWEQPYPANVEIRCQVVSEFDQPAATPEGSPVPPDVAARTPTPTPLIPRVRPTPKNFVQDIPGDTLLSNDEGGPVDEATPTSGTIERSFRAPVAPGAYFVRCYTPSDENNAIFQEFTLVPASAPG